MRAEAVYECVRYSNFDGDSLSALDLELKKEQVEIVAYISSDQLAAF